MLYDGYVIAKETNVISIADSEETLMLDFIPQQELSDKQALHPNTNQFASSLVQIEAPLELLKMEVVFQQYHVDKQCFEIEKKHFLIENDRLLDQIISQDTVNIVVNSSLDINTSVNVKSSVAMNDSVNYVKICNKSLKNDHRKVKGKDIVDNVAQVSNATTIAPGMYKLDPVILAPKVKNNREAHEYYLKHTMEQAAILRELLCYVRDTCPSNIPKETNRPLSSSTGVNPSTSTSESKPLGNIKNDRIPQTPNSNEKNKAKVQSRKVESCLNKRNFDFKNVCNELVKHLVKGSKALCSICNECLFDANHDICIIDHVNSMNVHAKSVSKKNKKEKTMETYSKSV
ncbi:hypothetical protein Tco_1215530 [Tanacetum coccineum]